VVHDLVTNVYIVLLIHRDSKTEDFQGPYTHKTHGMVFINGHVLSWHISEHTRTSL